jgi:uncharacterized protein
MEIVSNMNEFLGDAAIVFLSLCLESMPFVLLGSLLSVLAERWLTQDRMDRFLPVGRFAGIPAACTLGIFLPLCDCAIFPVARRLMGKGVSPAAVATFLCAAPILNPAVIASTAWAFSGTPSLLGGRIVGGVLVAILTGIVMGLVMVRPAIAVRPVQSGPSRLSPMRKAGPAPACACGHDHGHDHGHGLRDFPRAVVHEFGSNATWVIVGAAASALVQGLLPRTLLLTESGSQFPAIVGAMGFSWLISLCSNADAFVARSFLGPLGSGAAMAFMTFGAMLDLKNTIPLVALFPRRFALTFAACTFLGCLAFALLFQWAGTR